MTKDGVYFKEVEMTDIKCFKGTHKISFAKPNGEPQQWNVILGNNNTGKTTILKALASLEPKPLKSKTTPNAIISNEIKNKFKIFSILGNLEGWGFAANIENEIENRIMWIPSGKEGEEFESISQSYFLGYGISRKISETSLSNGEVEKDNLKGIFQDDIRYTNPEEWLLQLALVASKEKGNSAKLYTKVHEILTSDLLPDVKDIELIFETKYNTVQNYALFHTDYGKVRLRELGYGYQSTMVWVVDLAKKMFERFHKLENPLHGAAICLVDEIDLHLHPDWQRKIIKYLSGVFPNVQFIVTAHSPLIVQSAEDVNLIILEKDKENTYIRQEFGTFQGWTVEEILQDLMGLGEKTLSEKYLNELKKFENGIDKENYEKAKSAFDELYKILHPRSSQRKLLKLQLGSIAPAPSLV
jgi:predicted ATP-binding protein involved in virulence